jgi:hypothetical protein
MRCAPERTYWIDVPVTDETRRYGLQDLHGHVVITKEILTDKDGFVLVGIPCGQCWVVSPMQKVRFVAEAEIDGRMVTGTATAEVMGIPDAWLRPFGDLLPEDLDDIQRELQS